MLDWKHQIHHDEASLNPGFGPQARLNDAIGATHRLANQLTRIGLPTTQRPSQAQHHSERLGSDLQAQITKVKTAAKQLESASAESARALFDDLGAQAGSIVALLNDLHQVSLTDLGIAMIDTKSCRQLAGIPI